MKTFYIMLNSVLKFSLKIGWENKIMRWGISALRFIWDLLSKQGFSRSIKYPSLVLSLYVSYDRRLFTKNHHIFSLTRCSSTSRHGEASWCCNNHTTCFLKLHQWFNPSSWRYEGSLIWIQSHSQSILFSHCQSS